MKWFLSRLGKIWYCIKLHIYNFEIKFSVARLYSFHVSHKRASIPCHRLYAQEMKIRTEATRHLAHSLIPTIMATFFHVGNSYNCTAFLQWSQLHNSQAPPSPSKVFLLVQRKANYKLRMVVSCWRKPPPVPNAFALQKQDAADIQNRFLPEDWLFQLSNGSSFVNDAATNYQVHFTILKKAAKGKMTKAFKDACLLTVFKICTPVSITLSASLKALGTWVDVSFGVYSLPLFGASLSSFVSAFNRRGMVVGSAGFFISEKKSPWTMKA